MKYVLVSSYDPLFKEEKWYHSYDTVQELTRGIQQIKAIGAGWYYRIYFRDEMAEEGFANDSRVC